MKKYLFLLAAVAFFNAVWAVEVSAQTAKAVRAEIAFDFYVGEKKYPAGVYTIETNGERLLRLSGDRRDDADGRPLIYANLAQASKQGPPRLVFRRLGENRYLSRIFMGRGAWGYELPPTRRAREAAKNLSAKWIEVPAGN